MLCCTSVTNDLEYHKWYRNKFSYLITFLKDPVIWKNTVQSYSIIVLHVLKLENWCSHSFTRDPVWGIKSWSLLEEFLKNSAIVQNAYLLSGEFENTNKSNQHPLVQFFCSKLSYRVMLNLNSQNTISIKYFLAKYLQC